MGRPGAGKAPLKPCLSKEQSYRIPCTIGIRLRESPVTINRECCMFQKAKLSDLKVPATFSILEMQHSPFLSATFSKSCLQKTLKGEKRLIMQTKTYPPIINDTQYRFSTRDCLGMERWRCLQYFIGD